MDYLPLQYTPSTTSCFTKCSLGTPALLQTGTLRSHLCERGPPRKSAGSSAFENIRIPHAVIDINSVLIQMLGNLVSVQIDILPGGYFPKRNTFISISDTKHMHPLLSSEMIQELA